MWLFFIILLIWVITLADFQTLEPTLHSWNNVHLVPVYNFLYTAELYLLTFCLKVFCTYSYESDTGVQFCRVFFGNVFDFGGKVNTSFIKWIRKGSFILYLLAETVYKKYAFFKHLVELSSETIWV